MANVTVVHSISCGDYMKSGSDLFSVGCCTFQPFPNDVNGGRESIVRYVFEINQDILHVFL